jgi:3-oxoacyl-[acyl-carrier-protein] synthase-3
VIVERAPSGEGVLGFSLHADGKKAHLLRLEAGGIRIPASHQAIDAGLHFFKMEGKEVFKSAVAMMEFSSQEALANAGLKLTDVDWIIPHQANIRIIRALALQLKFPMEKIIVNIDRVANTSTASIPLALAEAYYDGRIKRGQILVLTAFGAGVTYGAVVMKF